VGTGKDEQPLDPRIERSRRVIGEAALIELAEAGYGGFTIDSVAKRAGVGRSTIYRHWDGKLPLIVDALDRLNEQPVPEPPDGNLRGSVETLLRHLAAVLTDSIIGRCVPALIDGAERDATVREFHHRYSADRRRALTKVIAAGVASGEFRQTIDPESASLALSGAIFYGRLMTGTPFDAKAGTGLADTVLGPATPRTRRS
jgi:AcrR family transcriptional regulator